MRDILAENLSGMAVQGTNATELGMLYNVTMDLKTGKLRNLVVDPGERTVDTEFQTDEQGRIHIPVTRVRAIQDHITIAT